jgi:hypothetical protein
MEGTYQIQVFGKPGLQRAPADAGLGGCPVLVRWVPGAESFPSPSLEQATAVEDFGLIWFCPGAGAGLLWPLLGC